MTNVVNSGRGYYGHRERQRDRILMTAEQLFTRDGIDNVSIADIADAVGMTRATIYRYFANRIEIAWALQRRAWPPSHPLKGGSSGTVCGDIAAILPYIFQKNQLPCNVPAKRG